MTRTKSKFHHIQTEPYDMGHMIRAIWYGRYDIATLNSYFSKMIRLIHYFIDNMHV